MNSKRTWMIQGLAILVFAAFWGASFSANAADPRVKKATAWYLKGNRFLKARQNGKAARAFTKAYRLLPRHPHFNCHRAQFMNYIGLAQERMRKPYIAMRSYYSSAYRSGCRKGATRNYAARRYRYLYNRWMSSIQVTTTPPSARFVQMTTTGDKQLGKTPFKKVFSPGKYKFKIRLYDHRTVYVNINLRAGMHVKKTYKLVKGDDPVNRPEKVDVAPPPPVVGGRTPATNNNYNFPAKRTKRKKRFVLSSRTNDPVATRGLDPSGTGDDGLGLRKPRRLVKKSGPPVYKQAWFWAVVGGVVAAGVIIPIVVPKEQKVLISQGKLY